MSADMHHVLISREEARRHIGEPGWLFVDCRFVIREPDAGERAFNEKHIRGALYAHLDRDLSGPVTPGRTGRHPLPSPEHLAKTCEALGISADTHVVAYDDSSGTMAAARLWWLLTWAGHDVCAVLDGSFHQWAAAGLPCESGAPGRGAGRAASGRGAPRRATVAPAWRPRFRREMALDAGQVLDAIADPGWAVLDARAAERYRGENETIDPVAGHITGAISAPHQDNLAPDGTFKSVQELRARLRGIVGERDSEHTVVYCGSGVTAAHEVLAFAHAGMGIPRLYPGSWSEWVTDPDRPVAR